MTAELKPCPFCGEAPRLTERAGNFEAHMCFVSCACGGFSARAHQPGAGATPEAAREQAIAAWNRRSPPERDGECEHDWKPWAFSSGIRAENHEVVREMTRTCRKCKCMELVRAGT